MINPYILMTIKDLNTKSVLDSLLDNDLLEREAAQLLWKSVRQLQRIKKNYKEKWFSWIIHKWRWKKSNNCHDPTKYESILKIIEEKYSDYWPTLASEILEEKHSIIISIPTLRREMIGAWIWKVKKRKKTWKQFHQRERKENYGEMIQYDGSYHKWLEERNWWEELCLLVSVDDATWEVDAKFDKSEWLNPTFQFWKEYIEIKWKPNSIYLDKFSTYKVNHPNATDDSNLITQFNRACRKLWIRLIFANTPQAKWRVERMNATLQDRLVKALREENITTMNEANMFLKDIFLPKFNRKFMVESRWTSDLHRELRNDEKEQIHQILSKHEWRKIMNDYTISFENRIFQLYRSTSGGVLFQSKERIIVETHLNGEIKISKKWRYIEYKELPKKPRRIYNFPLAPVSQGHLEYLRKEAQKPKENKIIEGKKESSQTYMQRTNKVHPWSKNFHLKWSNTLADIKK